MSPQTHKLEQRRNVLREYEIKIQISVTLLSETNADGVSVSVIHKEPESLSCARKDLETTVSSSHACVMCSTTVALMPMPQHKVTRGASAILCSSTATNDLHICH